MTPILIPKNKTETIRVALGEFKGAHFADVRIVTMPDVAAENPTFTQKGVAVPIRRLPALIDALQRALEEAQRTGLFEISRENRPTEAPASGLKGNDHEHASYTSPRIR